MSARWPWKPRPGNNPHPPRARCRAAEPVPHRPPVPIIPPARHASTVCTADPLHADQHSADTKSIGSTAISMRKERPMRRHPCRRPRGPSPHRPKAILLVEQLEDRSLLSTTLPSTPADPVDGRVHIAVVPNDPSFGSLWGLNNTGQSGGKYDADIDAPEAWDRSTGSTKTVVGILDTGIDYRHKDLYRNIWINQAEIPSAIRSRLTDTDGDGRITFWDLNDSRNQGSGKITD